jgi:hypothetical protein
MDDANEQADGEVGPVPAVVYELNGLLKRMTVETFPEVVEFGSVVGEEIW